MTRPEAEKVIKHFLHNSRVKEVYAYMVLGWWVSVKWKNGHETSNSNYKNALKMREPR